MSLIEAFVLHQEEKVQLSNRQLRDFTEVNDMPEVSEGQFMHDDAKLYSKTWTVRALITLPINLLC